MLNFKFRAKSSTTDNWIYGTYASVNGHHVLNEENRTIIIKLHTLGLCTYLKTKKQHILYEGDILRAEGKPDIYIVWDTKKASFGYLTTIRTAPKTHIKPLSELPIEEFYERIGNIYDNPEMMEE